MDHSSVPHQDSGVVAPTAAVAALPVAWLRGRTFDLGFIVGIAAVAIVSGLVVAGNPRLFAPILVLDLWLLGYHHVVATYTRLCFDGQGLKDHKFLVFQLPLIVLAAVAALAYSIGPWVLATVYLYWQWFHYTRQSWGISEVYRRKAGALAAPVQFFDKACFYLLPLWGILYRSWQDPGKFLGLELRVLPVPEIVVDVVGVVALAALAFWVATRLIAWQRGALPLAHTLYLVAHYAVFYVGYILIEDVSYGWLTINIWHNAQYIAFVWMYNTNRFKAGVDPKSRFLSVISQPRNVLAYLLVCFGISTALYLSIQFVVATGFLIIVYQAINFHHYVVDGVIWKVRRKPLQQTLGIAA